MDNLRKNRINDGTEKCYCGTQKTDKNVTENNNNCTEKCNFGAEKNWQKGNFDAEKTDKNVTEK